MPDELESLLRALNSDVKPVNIRLREGEYQHSLAETIASFELELCFPDAKALIRKLFGKQKTEDAQFVSKIQTILKKMEKSGIVKILPKEKPWELQRYALTSFKFQDIEKNQVIFATESETKGIIASIRFQQKAKYVSTRSQRNMTPIILLLVSLATISFATILWSLSQPTINLTIFVISFCITTICSIILGISIAGKSASQKS